MAQGHEQIQMRHLNATTKSCVIALEYVVSAPFDATYAGATVRLSSH